MGSQTGSVRQVIFVPASTPILMVTGTSVPLGTSLETGIMKGGLPLLPPLVHTQVPEVALPLHTYNQ